MFKKLHVPAVCVLIVALFFDSLNSFPVLIDFSGKNIALFINITITVAKIAFLYVVVVLFWIPLEDIFEIKKINKKP